MESRITTAGNYWVPGTMQILRSITSLDLDSDRPTKVLLFSLHFIFIEADTSSLLGGPQN